MIQGGNGRYHGNSRRETSLLETRQSGRKSERGEVASASADRFGSRALEEERRCASRPFLSSSLSLVVSPYASYQNRHFQLFFHLQYIQYIPIHVRQKVRLHSTRRIHAMRLIRLHSSATTSTSHYITARPRGGAMPTKKPTSLLVPCQL
jgi:hypothetical protein